MAQQPKETQFTRTTTVFAEDSPAGLPIIDCTKIVDRAKETIDPTHNGAILTTYEWCSDPTVHYDTKYVLSFHTVNSLDDSIEMWDIYVNASGERLHATVAIEDPALPQGSEPSKRDICDQERDQIDRFTQIFLQQMIIQDTGEAYIPAGDHFESIDSANQLPENPALTIAAIAASDPQQHPFVSLPFVTRTDTQYKQSWADTQHVWERIQKGIEKRTDQEFSRVAHVLEQDMCAQGLRLQADKIKEQLLDIYTAPARQFSSGMYINAITFSKDTNNTLQTEINIAGTETKERIVVTGDGLIRWQAYQPNLQPDGTTVVEWTDAVGDTLDYVNRLRLLRAKDGRIHTPIHTFVLPIDAARSCVVARLDTLSGAHTLFPDSTDTQTVVIYQGTNEEIYTCYETPLNRITNPRKKTRQTQTVPSSQFEQTFFQDVLKEITPTEPLTYKQLIALYKNSDHFQEIWTKAQQKAELFSIHEAYQTIMTRIQNELQMILPLSDRERDAVVNYLYQITIDNRNTPKLPIPDQPGISLHLQDPTPTPQLFGQPKPDFSVQLHWKTSDQSDQANNVFDLINLRADTGITLSDHTPYHPIVAYNIGRFLQEFSSHPNSTILEEARIAAAFHLPSSTQPPEVLMLIPSLEIPSVRVLRADPSRGLLEVTQTDQVVQERPLDHAIQSDRVYELVASVLSGTRDKTTLKPISEETTPQPTTITFSELQNIIAKEPQLWAREQIDAKVRAFADHLGWDPQTDTQVLADTLYALATNQQPGSSTDISMDALGALRNVKVTETGDIVIDMDWGNPFETSLLEHFKIGFIIKKGAFVIAAEPDGTTSVKLMQKVTQPQKTATHVELKTTSIDHVLLRQLFVGTPGTDISRAQYFEVINTMLQEKTSQEKTPGIYPRTLDPNTLAPSEIVIIQSVPNSPPDQPQTKIDTYTPHPTIPNLWQTEGQLPASEILHHIIHHVLPNNPYGTVTGKEYDHFVADTERLRIIDDLIQKMILDHPLLKLPVDQLAGFMATISIDDRSDVVEAFKRDKKPREKHTPPWVFRQYTQQIEYLETCLIDAFKDTTHNVGINWNLDNQNYDKRRHRAVVKIHTYTNSQGEQETLVAFGMHPQTNLMINKQTTTPAPKEIHILRHTTGEDGNIRIRYGGYFTRESHSFVYRRDTKTEYLNIFEPGDSMFRKIANTDQRNHRIADPPTSLVIALRIVSESIREDIKQACEEIISDENFDLHALPPIDRITSKIPILHQAITKLTDKRPNRRLILAERIHRLAGLPSSVPLALDRIIDALIEKKLGPYYEFASSVEEENDCDYLTEPVPNIEYEGGNYSINE